MQTAHVWQDGATVRMRLPCGHTITLKNKMDPCPGECPTCHARFVHVKVWREEPAKTQPRHVRI